MTPGQGFFVSCGPATANMNFDPAGRETGTADDFIVGRNAELLYMTLKLSALGNNYSSDFFFNPNASLGFDLGYDAAHWGDSLPDFALYSTLVQGDQGDKLVLQALNAADLANTTIPLGVKASQGEELTFSIDVSTLPASVEVYLDDVVANTTTLLNNADYVITPDSDLNGTGRFFLRYSEDALSTIDNDLDKLDVFAVKSTDEIIVNGQLFGETMLNLFDIQGRKVLSVELDQSLVQNRINVDNLNAGVYIVTVQNSSQAKTKKVIIE